ncbi:1-deoxy-D-xylulose-5-phosphate reductoisomerase [Paraferrimonas sedimenticola]|uniref:1-deoxy-D-xylulose 5-phosphate reductoisomerase n=1 Tax=Paraferrimonas sedimenticola TaxID=375674 RepID=A0AA37VXH4_9GAMM|nr:1-deoxy-D-xylulose-5-phosphate reductoisomerase [Paraferrimonas sedimenticola]GLP96716.1 1-deoxy-D-xylulose 5-phosphate reductoisomerase [Paraferrimonas sedimenticola]
MQQLAVLGATGSIGSSTLDVVRRNPHAYQLRLLLAHQNVDKMAELVAEFNPSFVAMVEPSAAAQLGQRLPELGQGKTQLLDSDDLVHQLLASDQVDMVMAAIVGAAGLPSTLAAVNAGKTVLLANKESLVMSGKLFIEAAHASGAQILPVDSEHNAIYQCMPEAVQRSMGASDLAEHGIERILLTGSGGPFLTTDLSELAHKTPAQACKHPNWSMGRKISVDSATMMNKGLEYIEAKWLFNATPEQLQVVIHPQSVIHSMVQFKDGSTLAQMGRPDMRTPIAHCMAYPQRIDAGVEPLDFFSVGQLSFVEPDFARYPGLKLAIDACHTGQAATTALNAANEVAVAAFLDERIGFTDIAAVNAATLDSMALPELNSIEAIMAWDAQAREVASGLISKRGA